MTREMAPELELNGYLRRKRHLRFDSIIVRRIELSVAGLSKIVRLESEQSESVVSAGTGPTFQAQEDQLARITLLVSRTPPQRKLLPIVR